MANALYAAWKELQKDIKPHWSYHSRKVIPGSFLALYTRHRPQHMAIPKKTWASVSKDKIPLKTINESITNNMNVFSIKHEKRSIFYESCKFFKLVAEDDNGVNGYHPEYLKSLNIDQLTLSHVNKLFTQYDQSHYREIIRTAIELVKAELPPDRLQIYDYDREELWPVLDFKLGFEEISGAPLIEKMYGEDGRVLGKLLSLEEESKVSSFLGVFKKYLTDEGSDNKCNEEKLYYLLKQWSRWDSDSKALISRDLEETIDLFGATYIPIIVFNNIETKEYFKQNDLKIFYLEIKEEECYELEQAAEEVGLKSPDNSGELHTSDKKSLEKNEQQKFSTLISNYYNILEPREASRLTAMLKPLGQSTEWSRSVFRVDSAHRNLPEGVEIPVPLPYLDLRNDNLFLVRKIEPIREILATLISACEFTTLRSALRDLTDLNSTVHNEKRKEEQFGNSEGGKFSEGVSTAEVSKAIKKALIPNTVEHKNGKDNREWKWGPDPAKYDELRNKIVENLADSLAAGPEIYKKKVRKRKKKKGIIQLRNDEKIIDSGSVSPNFFFNSEYDGQCQICQKCLESKSGKKIFFTYRIVEYRGSNWWADRPFNILCMCPNCHALSKHGVLTDFSNIFILAKDFVENNVAPRELPKLRGDFYTTPITLDGKESELAISPGHLNYFSALFESDDR